ncbi:techylectin-5A isoform X2 [Folsomia candida]|uniref:techylectin-5A isoform X2 n=1 Tax=Folsomia candida TaxID=158441 RepID=UPI000B8FAC41|nr:techylectin-5A isoform X2 [Folsomia candida]
MKTFATLALPFLAFLLTFFPQSGESAYTRGYASSSTTAERSRQGGYEVVIKLEDAFGEVGEDLKLIKDLAADMRVVKALLEDVSQDVKELRQLGPDTENLIEGSNTDRRVSQHSFSSGRNRTPPYRPQWEVSLPKLNCAELRLSGQKRSGVYSIQPDRTQATFETYCDMTTDGGGWTVIQRRGVLNVPKAVRENFYRTWKEYENGFGSVRSDYWLGLDKIFMLTQDCSHELIVNVTGWDNTSKFARYGRFNISGKQDSYRLAIANYTGNAGDGLLQHNKMRFSTYDKQNDQNGDENCAELYRGAWWYKDCFWSNLNGEYSDDGANGVMPTRSGMEWSSRHFYSYMKTEMKIRPKC